MNGVKERAEDAIEDAADSQWLERLARWGLAVRGVLYLIVAFLAVRLAVGDTGEQADKQGALSALARQPFGRVLMAVMAGGFAGYALWRFIEAIVGPADEDAGEDDKKALLKRLGYAARGLLYTVFFFSALRLVVTADEKAGSDNAEADWTARVLEWPAGPWLVGLAGLALVGGGLYIGWRGLSCKFRERLKNSEMTRSERKWIMRVGMAGMVARMVVICLIGALLVVAATQHDAKEVVGVDGALRRVADRPYGPTLLILVAAGLACYGLYCFAEARFRRVGDS